MGSLLTNCTTGKVDTVEYVAITNRDTAMLTLTYYEHSFYGKLKIFKPGKVIDSGEIQGNIYGDTLVGDFSYQPFGARHKKRRAYVLLNKTDSLIQGNGRESDYLGVPFYTPESINFNSPKFTFYLKE